jgi:hypothetical protein
MSNKFLYGMAAAFFAVFALGIGAVIGIAHVSDQTTISDVSSSSAPDTLHVATPAFAPFASTLEVRNEPAPVLTRTTAPAATAGAPTGIPVTDADINQLAAAVKLGAQGTGDVGKNVWARETPVAEKLLNGMCDCDQRNWLNHFVETGKEAVSGSENYFHSVQLLSALHRSDKDLTANQPSR